MSIYYKYSMIYVQFQTAVWPTENVFVAHSLETAGLEGNLIYKNPRTRDTLQNYDVSLITFFMLPRAFHRLKSSSFRYLAEVSVRKVLS